MLNKLKLLLQLTVLEVIGLDNWMGQELPLLCINLFQN